MPFIPHTQHDVKTMLAEIGVATMNDLFSEIPSGLRIADLPELPEGLSEMEVARLIRERAQQDSRALCFIGAGAYEHHIPAAVWEITGRGEFMTAYTPYQAEASQGTLQLLYEYQTMMASLMSLDVSNASMYDGATALAEAILMAVRLQRKVKLHRVLLPETLHPFYREVVKAIVSQQDIELVSVPFDEHTGRILFSALQSYEGKEITALVIPQPNFFGVIEEVDELTNWAHAHQAFAIGVVNPMAMALLKPPGRWGKKGADMACGEGQPLGVPLSSGGPYYGFLCCKSDYVRQMPGRIVGRTRDAEGKKGFVLTLQAREQHIRRAKANSNICTNQGLLVTASTIYMSLLGPKGLKQVALASHQNLIILKKKLTALKNVECAFTSPSFHELVVKLPKNADIVLSRLAEKSIQGGIALHAFYPELPQNYLLICVTETKTEADIDQLVSHLKSILNGSTATSDAVSLAE